MSSLSDHEQLALRIQGPQVIETYKFPSVGILFAPDLTLLLCVQFVAENAGTPDLF